MRSERQPGWLFANIGAIFVFYQLRNDHLIHHFSKYSHAYAKTVEVNVFHGCQSLSIA